MTGTVPHYHGHRRRLKEKYLAGSIDGWLEYEILELVLTYALPRRDVKPLAKELLARFKTLSGILNAGLDELTDVPGISEHAAIFLRLLKDVARHYVKQELFAQDLLSSPQAVVDYFRSVLKGARDEEMYAVFLTAANRLIAVEKLHAGTVTRSAVYPRTFAERALAHHAVGVIIAHNHPGGSLQPSKDDCAATEAVKRALATVEVTLLDHLIITAGGHYSWKENGLL